MQPLTRCGPRSLVESPWRRLPVGVGGGGRTAHFDEEDDIFGIGDGLDSPEDAGEVGDVYYSMDAPGKFPSQSLGEGTPASPRGAQGAATAAGPSADVANSSSVFVVGSPIASDASPQGFPSRGPLLSGREV